MMSNLPAAPGYQDVIIRAAQDHAFDISKLERLVELQEAVETRAANRAFNEAMSVAQGEMAPISANASNPQTHSRYATYAKLDQEVRPIYSRHGFAICYNTEPIEKPNEVRVVGLVSHGPITRRHEIDMPVVTQGIRGTDMMTRTHAVMSAVSYGKRGLLGMIFNLAIDRDDDGNRAGAYRRDEAPQQQRSTPQPPPPPVDPETGEVSPHEVQFVDAENGERESWQQWAARINAAVATAKDEGEVDQWVEKNVGRFDEFRKEAPVMLGRLEAAINKHRNRLKAGKTGKE